jgi:hypothetical protein
MKRFVHRVVQHAQHKQTLVDDPKINEVAHLAHPHHAGLCEVDRLCTQLSDVPVADDATQSLKVEIGLFLAPPLGRE